MHYTLIIFYSGLRNYFICREKCKTWKLTNKSENILILWLEAYEPRCCFNARIVNNGSSCIPPRISDQSSAVHTDNNWTALKF